MVKRIRKKKVGKNKILSSILKILNGQVLTEKGSLRLIPFSLYLVFLAILFIANTHYAERTVREISKVDNELNELKSEYITTKSELMYNSKQSQVAATVESMGMYESIEPPKKIVLLKKEELSQENGIH